LLLATDLCARCDRPLDRAKQLALEWQSELLVLTVREGPRTPEEVASWLDRDGATQAFELAARRELDEEFQNSPLSPSLRVVEGDVTDSILEVAATLEDALVVTGASSEGSFQQLMLGSTAERLAQDLPHPLLVVRQRSRGPYARILVANDFSAASRRALEAACRLFPGRRIVLFHVLEALGEPVAGAVQEALEASERFLDACVLPAGAREHVATFIGHGSVTDTISRYALEQATQLVVLGVHPQSGVARMFMGSRSEDLLQHLACDTLLVRSREDKDDG
jgi:nucleotide-binding universal stress UspA family protein